MMKKFISAILFLAIIASITVEVSATRNFTKKKIPIIYGGERLSADVLSDDDGTLFVPITWMTYFGLYDYRESDDSYVFFPKGEEENHDFAKRIFISKDGTAFVLSYYTDAEGFNKSRFTYQDTDAAHKAIAYLNRTFPNSATYQPVLSGTFSDQHFEGGTLYLPLSEVVPFFNAKVQISSNNELIISPNPISISEALYSIDIAELAFNASSDMKAKGFITFSAYILDTFNVLNLRFDRLLGYGKLNDYKKLFKGYLIDDATYLAAFDKRITPSSAIYSLASDTNTLGKSAISVVTNTGKLYEYINGAKTLDVQNPSWEAMCTKFKDVGVSDIYSGAYKIFDYWYHYENQVSDHSKMLGAVYVDGPLAQMLREADSDAYHAAQLVQALYGNEVADKLVATAGTAMLDLGTRFLEGTADTVSGYALAPYKVSYNALMLVNKDFRDAVEQLKGDAMLYVIDENAQLVANSYFAMRYSEQYTTESLDNLRLCAIFTLVASKQAYTTLWGKDYTHEKVPQINEALMKLYLAADGVECDSTDYYEKTKAYLNANLKNLLVESVDPNMPTQEENFLDTELYKIAAAVIPETIMEWCYDDFDSDGKKEAFISSGDVATYYDVYSPRSLWYISATGHAECLIDHNENRNFGGIWFECGDYKLYQTEARHGAGEIYGVKNGAPVLVTYPYGYYWISQHPESGMIYAGEKRTDTADILEFDAATMSFVKTGKTIAEDDIPE